MFCNSFFGAFVYKGKFTFLEATFKYKYLIPIITNLCTFWDLKTEIREKLLYILKTVNES